VNGKRPRSPPQFLFFFFSFFPQIENQLGSFPQTAAIYGNKTKPSTLKLEDRAAAGTAQHKQLRIGQLSCALLKMRSDRYNI
jgi:hypothetical protein